MERQQIMIWTPTLQTSRITRFIMQQVRNIYCALSEDKKKSFYFRNATYWFLFSFLSLSSTCSLHMVFGINYLNNYLLLYHIPFFLTKEEYYKNNNNNNNSMTNTNCNANNIQWNIWQQFQWPNQPEQNRWSKFCVAFVLYWRSCRLVFWLLSAKRKILKCQLHVCDRPGLAFLLLLSVLIQQTKNVLFCAPRTLELLVFLLHTFELISSSLPSPETRFPGKTVFDCWI